MFIPEDRAFLTIKAGKWTFTASCDSASVYPLLVRARTMFEAVSAIPVLPQWKSHLKTELITRSIFSTAALEGNPLTQEEVASELSRPPSEQMHDTSAARREIHNLNRLYARLDTIGQQNTPLLTEESIRAFHATICEGIPSAENIPGQYRNMPVVVGDREHGGVYTPPKILADIRTLMQECTTWLNSEEMLKTDPLLRAACAHYYLVRIHPFRDGNGRTARFAEACILASAGMQLVAPMLSNFYYRFKDEYFRVISETEKAGDMTPFFVFFLNAVYEEMKVIQNEIIPIIKVFIMRDLLSFLNRSRRITRRQQSLMEVLLGGMESTDMDGLYEKPELAGYYRNVSRSTARRDLKKLTDMGLLVQKGKQYAVNFDSLNM